MKQGDRVRVYPLGKPELSAVATVAIISGNERSIAVGFEDKPPFTITDGAMAVHPVHGLMLFATRAALLGMTWGPWVEMFSGGQFEIKEQS